MYDTFEAFTASRCGRPKLPLLNWPVLPRFDRDLTRSLFSCIHARDALLLHYQRRSKKIPCIQTYNNQILPCRWVVVLCTVHTTNIITKNYNNSWQNYEVTLDSENLYIAGNCVDVVVTYFCHRVMIMVPTVSKGGRIHPLAKIPPLRCRPFAQLKRK